ncbi:MAG: glycoside hydrolase family 88 protein [Bacteroidales bacterium]|nr:MAG: glycoside hydrolase family 88 protein [Bacteroidales bacterium]
MMKTKIISISLTILLLSPIFNKTSCNDRLSIVYGNQFSVNNVGWTYMSGVVLTAFEQLYFITGDSNYYNIIKVNTNKVVSEYGDFNYEWLYDSWTVDDVRSACQIPTLYHLTGDERYRMSADTVFNFIQNAPRNSYGEFWHKSYYYNETLLDGIYMGCPFYAAYNKVFSRPEFQDDVVHQIAEMYAHVWDPVKKLPYHGWYDFENDTTGTFPYWDLKQTGVSTIFWGRSIGWYAMAIVDVLDFLPKEHPQRDSVIGVFNDLAEGIAMYQDPDSLVWWQVVDQAKRDSNWIESSASCMFVYALAKGVRMGYIDSAYLETVTTGYQGILDKFLVYDSDELVLRNVCRGTVVGPDYAFYVGRDKITGGSHADGAFILASIEIEMMDSLYPPGLLGIDSVIDGAINISWYNNQHNVLGYILERKTDGDFIKIADLGADTTCYTDILIEPNNDYVYRVCAYIQNDTSRWSNQLRVTSANVGGLPSQAFSPYPENNATEINTDQVLKWKKGLLADYHKLYLGTTNPPPFVADIYKISFTPENLNIDSVYYWRIDEVNEKGITAGETWRFYMENFVTGEFLQNIDSLNIYPNPASEKLHIEFLKRNSLISVYDLNGKLYYRNAAEKEKLEIDIKNWQKGIYIIQVKDTERIIHNKLVKK